MKVLILSSRARTILKYSCSLTVVIFKSQACVYLTWSLQRSPVIQALSGHLVAQSSRSSDRCLLHWRPSCSALGRFLGRVYSTYSLALLWWCCRPGGLFFLLRQVRAQTNQYCNPIPGSPLWVLALGTRSSLSCGRWFLPHWRCPQSALGPWCLRLLRPIGA